MPELAVPTSRGNPLEIERLGYRYPDSDRDALREVSLSVAAGELIVLAGRSASGKSTLLRAACGLVPHFHGGEVSGRVAVAGHDTREAGPGELAGAVGYVAQDPETQVVSTTVRAEIELPLELRGEPAAARARAVEEVALALAIPHLLGRATDTLSGGELQRVALAAALVTRPELVLLDEPTSQLDPVAGDELIWLLRRLNEEWGVSILMAEHRLERCLAAADRVVAMDEGEIAFDGAPREFLAWALEHDPALSTPGARLFSLAGLDPLPVGVRDARDLLQSSGREGDAGPPPHSRPARGTAAGTRVVSGARVRKTFGGDTGVAPSLEARDLWVELDRGEELHDVLRGIDLQVRAGERIALMGRNGAGKSTFLRTAAGLIEPVHGRVNVQGGMALLGQSPDDYLVRERVGEELPGIEGGRALAAVGLQHTVDRDPKDLSGGERQRLALAIALAGRAEGEVPRVVALDEPTRGMDRARKDDLAELIDRLARGGAAVLVATHDVEFAATFAERVVLLGDGVVIADADAEEVLSGGWYFATEVARILGFPGVVTAEAGAELIGGDRMSWQLASFVVLGLVLVGGFAWYERSRPPSQIVALVAALAALAIAGRIVVAAIPNVVATTDIVIFSGYALGAAPGFAVGALAGLISNFWLGQGPWTPWQMAGWGLAGILGAVLAWATRRRAGRLELTLTCGFAGIAYGALLNFSLMVSYGGEFTLDRWLALEARAVPFDLAHAIGNVALALVAGPAMVRMLIRFRERFEFRWRPADGRAAKRRLAGETTAVLLLLLVVSLPGPASAAGSPAVRWLERAENADGGFGAVPGQESDTQMTGWVMLGLESAGVNPLDIGQHGNSPVAYLRRNLADVRTPGDLARTILALSGAGVDPRHFGGHDLIAKLAAQRRPNGSYEGWPNSTAFAVMALRSDGSGAGVSRSLAWLRRVQSDDGGWGAVPGAPGDPDSTGAVLQALGGGSVSARRAVGFLRRNQQAGGGWGLAAAGPVNTQSTAWAIQGLLAAGVNPSSVRHGGRSGLDYLASRRASDGHYRYSSSSNQTSIWVTGQVLAAANERPFPLAAVPRATSAGSGAGSKPTGGAGRSKAGKGGAGPPSERLPHPRAGRNTGTHGASSRGPRVRRGAGSAQAAQDGPASQPSTNAAFTSAPDKGGGSTPLVPIAIGLGAAALVAGGGWWAARRFAGGAEQGR